MRITFNTADVAATPALDCGEWSLTVPDADVLSRVEALQILGFNPVVSLDN